MRKNNTLAITQEKKKLLDKIHQRIIENHKQYNVPMIFKTNDCAADEWIGMNINTNHIQKLRFIKTGERTIIVEVTSGREILHF